MRRRLFAGISIGTAACALFAGVLSQCFSPDLPACSFLCGPPDQASPRCPEDYECRADGVCHQIGGTDVCPFTVDLLPVPDLSGTPDGPVTADGGSGDGGDGGG